MSNLPELWAIVAAPFIGSFLGVVVARYRAPATIVIGRSSCEFCAVPLHPSELVPVLSWVFLRGRCRYCGESIGLFYPLIELGAVAIPVWLVMDGVHGREFWIGCTLGLTLLCLSMIDIRFFTLPDFLTLPLAGAGLLVNWALNMAPIVDCVAGIAAGYVFIVAVRGVYFLVRKREGIGLGDAKLLAAAGAWVTWAGLPSVIAIASLSGVIVVLAGHRRTELSAAYRVPFGAFLCAGWWLVWMYGPLVLTSS